MLVHVVVGVNTWYTGVLMYGDYWCGGVTEEHGGCQNQPDKGVPYLGEGTKVR